MDLRGGKNHRFSAVNAQGEWYTLKNIDVLFRQVRQWDILQLELSNDSPRYKWALVIGRSGFDFEIAQILPENELHTASAREVIAGHSVRINNNRVHVLDAEEDHYEAEVNIMLHVMAHYLGNRPLTSLISSLEDEFRQLPGEQERHTKLKVYILAKVALMQLMGLVARGCGGQVREDVGKVSNWFDNNHINTLKPELCVGDRLEFSRWVHSHWGIFLGQLGGCPLVLHFFTARSGIKYMILNNKSLGSLASDKPAYRIDSIEKPLGKRKMRINNERDKKWPPLKPDEILDGVIHRIASQTFLESPEYYSVLNSEHFANELRYSKHHCEQVPQILGRLSERLSIS